MVDFYQQLCEAYTYAPIGLVQDNWPVHFHPDVLASLQPQKFPYPVHYPSNWPQKPSQKARTLNLPIRLFPLPTYASWCNPSEKLWRWVKQEIVHLHRYADRWQELKELVSQFLDQFANGSQQLLRYVGLLKPAVSIASRSPRLAYRHHGPINYSKIINLHSLPGILIRYLHHREGRFAAYR